MFARHGLRVALLDCDPQCDLSARTLSEDDLELVWSAPSTSGDTVATCLEDIRRGQGGLAEPHLRELDDNLLLLPGDLRLGRFESTLAHAWPRLLTDDDRALLVTTALDRLAARAAEVASADLVMLDVGSNLSVLNRATLLAADAVVIPVAPDLLSLRGLENVGEALREWRAEWATVRAQLHAPSQLQERRVEPIGYIVQQVREHTGQPVRVHAQWLAQIPQQFAAHVRQTASECDDVRRDPDCLGLLPQFSSLAPLADATRKPLFELKHVDGVLGSQFTTVARASKAFAALSTAIGERLDRL